MEDQVIAGSNENINSKKNNKISLTKIVVCVFLILIFIAILYLIKNFLAPVNNISAPSVSPTIKPLITQSQEENETLSGWETYISNDYQFDYPSDFELKTIDENTLSLYKLFHTQTEATELFDGISLTFITHKSNGLTLDSFVQSNIDEIEMSGLSQVIDTPKSIKINDYSGLTYTIEGLGVHKYIVIQSKNADLMIEIIDSTVDPGDIGFSDIVDQIFSTFKFTNE